MKRMNGRKIWAALLVGLFLTGVAGAEIHTSPQVFRSFVDFDAGYRWRINATRVTATAAQLNQMATGIITGTLTVTGDTTLNSDVILENDEMLRNDVDGDVELIFDDDSAVLGQLILDTSIAIGAQADNDLYEILFRAMDTETNVTDYVKLIGKITDNTSGSEDAQAIIQTTVNGTPTTQFTIGSPAGGTTACTIVPPLGLTALTASLPVFTDANKILTSSGTMPVNQGGTGLTAGTSGGVLAYTATGTLASSALLAQYGIVLGGGAGAAPATLAASANTGAPLLSAGNAANPAYGPLNLAGGATIVSGAVPVANGGTALTSGTSGGILAYTATGTLASSALLTQYGLITGGGAGVAPSAIAVGLDNTVLVGNTGAVPSFRTIVNADIATNAAITGSRLDLSTPGAIGGTVPSAGAFTTLTLTGDATLENLAYLDAGTTAAIGVVFPSASVVSNLGQVVITSTDTNIDDNYVSDIAGLNAMHDAGTNTAYASLRVTCTDVSNGNEDATLTGYIKVAGVNTPQFVIDDTGIETPGEVTADGKYAAVGGDATTGLMMLTGTADLGAAGTVTSSFSTVFGAAPIVTWSYTSAPATSNVFYTGTVTASNVIFFGSASDTLGYIAVGQRP